MPISATSRRRLVQAHVFGLLVVSLALLGGCNRTPPQVLQAKPPEVTYVRPHSEEVRDYEDYTGRTEAIPKVEIRARITGELTKVFFEDGKVVAKDQPLFQIDPRPFDAALQNASATVHQATGDLKRKKILYERGKELRAKGTVSQEDLDNYEADHEIAKALLELAEANRKTAELNREFCDIRAPIAGLISRKLIDEGNQVMANTTPLTTIVNLNPMYADFDVDERTLLRLRRLLQIGELQSARDTKAKLDVGLADEDGFSLTGIIDFSNNVLDAGTGTLRVRVHIDNSTQEELIGPAYRAFMAAIPVSWLTPANGALSNRRLLSPNMFVRIRFWIGDPKSAILVPEAALVSDQGIRHLFVINDEDKVEYRPVTIGLQHGDQRVIKRGVTAKDRIIVSGLQRVRAGIKVTATEEKAALAASN
jgi:RND family efflux transporter MFP subunit